MAALADVFTAFRTPQNNVEDVISTIAQAFPDPKEAFKLKFNLVTSENFEFSGAIKNTDVLRRVLTLPDSTAFAGLASVMDIIVTALFLKGARTAYDVATDIISRAPNELGEAFLNAIVEIASADNLTEIYQDVPSLFNLMLRKNPKIARFPFIWHGPVQRQWEVLDIVSSTALDDQTCAAIAKAIVDTDSDEIAWKAGTTLGDEIVYQFMEAFSRHPTITWQWKRVMSAHSRAVLTWLRSHAESSPQIWIMAAQVLDPSSTVVRDAGTESWLEYVGQLAQRKEIDSSHFFAFCLALAFMNPDQGAPRLVSSSFQVVHDAAKTGTLNYEGWRLVAPLAPSLAWWHDWDRCERLRAALVDKFIEYHWPSGFFLSAIQDESTFAAFLELKKTSKARKHFLENVARDVLTGSITTEPYKTSLLRRVGR